MDHKYCRHCGGELPPKKPGRGKPRVFCRDSCRVMYAYRLERGFTTNRERLLAKATRDGLGEYESVRFDPVGAAWLAAMVDGEGFISVNQHRNRKGYIFPVIGICNNSDRIIGRAVELVGEKWTMVRKRRTKAGYRQLKVVTIARVAMLDFLEGIRPYLVEKTRQADLTMEFCRTHNALPVRSKYPSRFLEIFEEMRGLNKRGWRPDQKE